ncbi:MAG TPA: alpha/beta fold hydrolase [Gemmatimonadaceae bacterium]|nr:alpha/beta fold hydrolase [Gemmatimonadaceae bacterium]
MRTTRLLALASISSVLLTSCSATRTDVARQPAPASSSTPNVATEGLDMFEQQMLFKRLTDLEYFTRLEGEMLVNKVRYPGAGDMVIPAYVFAPKDTSTQRPVILLVHGGVHGDFDINFLPQVRSLVRQGYIVVGPEYRGSTGYGRAHYDSIDYGGKEVEDVIAALDYLRLFVPNADLSRVGITGRSHGGFIALHAIFRRPELFKVAVAHVPVTDLPTRIRTHSENYHRIFAAQKGFGGRLEQNPRAYVERSPIAHVRKLRTPLLVQAADNDDDVFIIENHNLRDSMRVAGMEKDGLYTYKEWPKPPGGHGFHRIESKQGREAWDETLAFLERYLKR